MDKEVKDKKYYENIEKELEKYKEFFNEAPIALFRTDLVTGKFIMANKHAAKTLGFLSVDTLLKEFKSTDLYAPEERKKLIQLLNRDGYVRDYEIKFEINEQIKWVSANMHINYGNNCIEGSFVDITPLVEMRDKNLIMLKKVGEQIEKRITALAG